MDRRLERYQRECERYFRNALAALEKGEWDKAGELLWGSLAKALKALAATREERIRSHNRLRDFALQVSGERKDKELWDVFKHAEALHRNFYESEEAAAEDVGLAVDEVRATIAKLFRLIEEAKAAG